MFLFFLSLSRVPDEVILLSLVARKKPAWCEVQDEDAVNVESVEESNFAQAFFSLLASGGSAAVVGVDHVAGSSPGHGCGPTSGARSHPWS